jgi:glyoxylase-like metal-dependent hydrolase (beta-lactamase superfamily II)
LSLAESGRAGISASVYFIPMPSSEFPMRKTSLVLIFSFAFAIFTIHAATPSPSPSSETSAKPGPPPSRAVVQAAIKEGFARQTQPVTEHVHLIWRSHGSTDAPFEGNSIVIEQKDGLVVVDAGGAPVSGANIVAQIKAISKKPVRFLVYTHYHGDHNLGAGEFLKAWPGLTIISTEATRRNMLGPAMDYIKTYSKGHEEMVQFAGKAATDVQLPQNLRDKWAQVARVGVGMIEAYKNLKPYPAAITFTDRLTLNDEMAPVEIMFLGKANTDGDAVIWAPKQRVLASGDIVVNPIPYSSASFPAEWISVLEKLKGFEFAYLIPGHGQIQTDRVYVDKLIELLTEIRDKVTPLARQGLSVEEIRKQVDLEPMLVAFAGTDRWDRAQMKNFFFGAIIPNAMKEARGEPIVQGHDGG